MVVSILDGGLGLCHSDLNHGYFLFFRESLNAKDGVEYVDRKRG